MDLTLVLGAAAVVVSVLVLFWAVSGRRPQEPVSLAVHSSGRTVGTQQDLRARNLAPDAAERAVQPLLDRFGAMLRAMQPHERIAGLAQKIRRAGSPPGWTVERVLAARLLGAVVLGALMLVRFAADPTVMNVLMVAVAVLLGYFGPIGLLDAKVNRRQDLMRAEVSSVIDQLAVMVRAGLSIDAAVVRVAQTGEGPMAEELQRVVQDMRVGVGRTTALTAMADRVDIPELRGFVAALAQADQLGVPVADTLRVQAEELRTKQQQFAEEQAMKLPVKILFPMVLCILPVIFIVLLGPAAIDIYNEIL